MARQMDCRSSHFLKFVKSATLTEHHKNALFVVPTVKNSWIDEVIHRPANDCSIFMITCQGQAATPCLGLPPVQNLWIDVTLILILLCLVSPWFLHNRFLKTYLQQHSCMYNSVSLQIFSWLENRIRDCLLAYFEVTLSLQ